MRRSLTGHVLLLLTLGGALGEHSKQEGNSRPAGTKTAVTHNTPVSTAGTSANQEVSPVPTGQAPGEIDGSPAVSYFYYNSGGYCGYTSCSIYATGCCGNNCCSSGYGCCDIYGYCTTCSSFDDDSDDYLSSGYCGYNYCTDVSGCCGSNCCYYGYGCCDSYGYCTTCDYYDDNSYPADDFSFIYDDFYYNWQCGYTQCYSTYGSYEKPNGCCENSCCYGDDYCCDYYGDCTLCYSDDDTVVATAVGVIVGVSVGGFVLCAGIIITIVFCVIRGTRMRNGGYVKSSTVIPVAPAAQANVNGIQLQTVAYGTVVSAASQFGGQQPVSAYASVPAQYGSQPMVQYGGQQPIQYGAQQPVQYGAESVNLYGLQPLTQYNPQPPFAAQSRALVGDDVKIIN
jgi:hypothetical protein